MACRILLLRLLCLLVAQLTTVLEATVYCDHYDEGDDRDKNGNSDLLVSALSPFHLLFLSFLIRLHKVFLIVDHVASWTIILDGAQRHNVVVMGARRRSFHEGIEAK